MRHALLIGVLALTCAAVYAGGRAVADIGSRPAERVTVDAPRAPRPTATLLPLVFEENRGQGGTPERFDFVVRCRGYQAFVSSGEVVFSFDGAPLTMTTVDATPREPDVAGLRLPGKSNYLIGNDPEKWITGVPQTRGARYRDTAPGVSWTFGGRGRALEFAFDVAPGAESPRMRLDGATDVSVAADGSLRVEMPHGVATFSRPVAWQEERSVAAAWALVGVVARVALGAHDRTRTVHVDPTVAYQTYLGGSDDDAPTAAAIDSSGNVYVVGPTKSANFPKTSSAYDESWNSDYDGYITKFAPGGAALVFSTFIGSTGDDRIQGLAIDSSRNIYVSGATTSSGYPTTAGAFQTTKSGSSFVAFLTKLAASGASLTYSSFTNGEGTFQSVAVTSTGSAHALPTSIGYFTFSPTGSSASQRSVAASGNSLKALCIDASDNVYVVGSAANGLPTTTGAYDTTPNGNGDAILIKMNPAGARVFATYLGGAFPETAWGVGVNLAGQAYVVGQTGSIDFPVTGNAHQGPGSGGVHAFLTRFNAAGSDLQYSTYFRGNSTDVAYGIAVHPTGACVIAGETQSATGFPVLAPWQSTFGGSTDAFAAKFERDGTLSWSSYSGGSGNDYGRAVGMGPDGSVAIAGFTFSTDHPTVSPYQSAIVGLNDLTVTHVPDSLTSSLTIPVVTTQTLPEWTVGIPFSQQITHTGGLGPYSWSLVSGEVPPGLTLSSTQLLSGTPTDAGDFTIAVRVSDSCDLVSADRQLSLRVHPTPTIAAAAFPDRTIGIAIDQTLSLSGGTGALVVSLDSGSLPTGVFLSPLGRALGTPENAGDFSFTARVTDTLGGTSVRAFSMHVNPLPVIDAAALPDWTESIAFGRAFTASGGTGALTWSLVSGTLPVTTPLDPATGQIVGPARAAGDYDFTLRVTDTQGVFAERSFTMHVNAFPQFVTQSLPLAFAQRPFSVQLVGSGGTPPLAFALDASVGASLFPAGLGLSNGAISGTPTRADRKLPTITYTDLRGAVARRAFAIEVAGRLDVVAKQTSEEVTIGSGASGSFKRYLELLEGTTLNASLRLKGKGIFTTDLALTGPDGSAIDLAAFRRATPKSVTISKLPVPATGRYVLAIVRGADTDGQAVLSVSIAPQAKWAGAAAIGAVPVEFAFSAPPGAVPTIVAKAAKGSTALPTIVAVLDEGGTDVAAGVVAKEKGGSATLKLVTPLTGGRYRAQFAGRDGSAGGVAWSVSLKLPKTYDFALPGLGAGDGF